MKFRPISCLLLLTCVSGFGATITIDFETLGDGATLVDQYIASGVLFGNANLTSHTTTAGGELLFGGNVWAGCIGCIGSSANTIVITFVDPADSSIAATTNYVAWDTLGLLHSGGIISGFTAAAFDLNGNFLGSTDFSGGSGPLSAGTESLGYAGIHSVTITYASNAGALGFDNLTFNSVTSATATPEPATALPLAAGLLALAFRRKSAWKLAMSRRRGLRYSA